MSKPEHVSAILLRVIDAWLAEEGTSAIECDANMAKDEPTYRVDNNASARCLGGAFEKDSEE